ncbi:hypothetical protein ACUNWD_10035 [Sunxiuqinia sp. A32]|uniref:hypothetical protein n=1 Tax=Sunxiuqinia sp. A32 TaxID=3461496 RepID=UPI004045DA8D
MKVNLKILGLKVATLYPELANKLTAEPKLEDISLIPDIHKNYFDSKVDVETRYQFIAVVLLLYDPDSFGGWTKLLKRGIRPIIASRFGIANCSVSHAIESVRNYYNVYKGFKDQVNEKYKQVLKHYK